MRIGCAGSFLVEDVWKVVIFFRDGAEVDGCIRECRAGLCSHLREGKLEDFSAIHPTDASECSCVDEGNFWCFKLRSCSWGLEISVASKAEACKGRDVSDELSTCRVTSNEILPNTQSINRL